MGGKSPKVGGKSPKVGGKPRGKENNMNEIVKYRNEMNDLFFGGETKLNRKTNKLEYFTWSKSELVTFFAIISRMRDKQKTEITLSFDYLKELTNHKRKGYGRLIETLKDMYNYKLGMLHSMEMDERGNYYGFPIFDKFDIMVEENQLVVKANQRAVPLLNNITNKFTRFQLSDLTELKSRYSILLFRQLKQFRLKGIWTVSWDKYKTVMGVEGMSNDKIRERAVRAPVKELNQFFDNLNVKSIYKSTKKGRELDKLQFTFTPEDPVSFEDKDAEDRFADYNLKEGNISPERWGELGNVYEPTSRPNTIEGETPNPYEAYMEEFGITDMDEVPF